MANRSRRNLDRSTFPTAAPPPIDTSPNDLPSEADRAWSGPAWHQGVARPANERVDFGDIAAPTPIGVDDPQDDSVHAELPLPPLVPRIPRKSLEDHDAPSSDISSLSPVASAADAEVDAELRAPRRNDWYAAAVGGLTVAAAGVLLLWTPARPARHETASAQQVSSACLADPPAGKPPVDVAHVAIRANRASLPPLDSAAADAAMVVGTSASKVCASGAQEPRNAHVVVSFDPSGAVTARVTTPIDLIAASCVAQAFSRQRLAPFDGVTTTLDTVVQLDP